MKCAVGIDLGSTTTKAVILDEEGRVLGRGITNSRSNYDLAAELARTEAFVAARFALLRREVEATAGTELGGSTLPESAATCCDSSAGRTSLEAMASGVGGLGVGRDPGPRRGSFFEAGGAMRDARVGFLCATFLAITNALLRLI